MVGAIVAEWTGGEEGLGVLINLARGSLFDIPLLFATLVLIALVGIALYASVLVVERRVGSPAPDGPRLAAAPPGAVGGATIGAPSGQGAIPDRW